MIDCGGRLGPAKHQSAGGGQRTLLPKRLKVCQARQASLGAKESSE
jgi:hypothetical protein